MRSNGFQVVFAITVVGGLTLASLSILPARAGVYSYYPFNSDANSGVGPSSTYTHLANVRGSNVAVNGQTFVSGDTSGAGWTLSASSKFDNSNGSQPPNIAVGQAVRNLVDDFRYNTSALTLTGLTPGQSYTTTLYNKSWGGVKGRVNKITGSDSGGIATRFDENFTGGTTANLLKYTYAAPAAGQLGLGFTHSGASYHTYAFSNEIAPAGRLLFSDHFDSATKQDVNVGYAGRQTGSLAPLSYSTGGTIGSHLQQVGDSGATFSNVLRLTNTGWAGIDQNFNNHLSAGGLKISFQMDPNNATDLNWGQVTVGADAFGNGCPNRGGNHFSILFRGNGDYYVFDAAAGIASGTGSQWAANQMSHFEVFLTDTADGNPFNGAGETQVDVYAYGNNAAAPFHYTYTKTGGGYANNFINIQGLTDSEFDNLAVTQLFNEWDKPGGGTWNSAGNWTGGYIPDGIDIPAAFTDRVTAGTVTVDSPVTVGEVHFTSSSQYTIGGASTLTMQTSTGDALLRTTGANATFNAPLNLASDTTAEVWAGQEMTLAGAVSGPGKLTKAGGGTLSLSGVNTYGGVTTVSGGLLALTASTATLGSTAAGTVVQSGAALRIENVNMTLDEPLTLSGTGVGTSGNTYGALRMRKNTGVYTLNGAITLDGGAAVNTYNAGVATVTIAQGIGGTRDLELRASAANNGGALYKLQGQSTYTGATILSTSNTNGNGVTVQNEIDNALPTTTVLKLQAGTSSNASITSPAKYRLNGYDQQLAGIEAGTATRTVNSIVGGSGTLSTLTVNTSANSNFSGLLGGSGANENNLAVIKTGSGTLTLTGNNTYTGSTLVQQGILELRGDNVSSDFTINNGARLIACGIAGNFIGDTSDIQIDTGGTFELQENETMGGLSGGGSLEMNSGSNRGLVVGNGNETTTFSGTISETGTGRLSLTKVGNGTLVLGGSNTYGGVTNINAGTLNMQDNIALGAGGHNAGTMTWIYDGGALELRGGITTNEHAHFRGAGPSGGGAIRSISGNNVMTDRYAMDADSTIGVDAGTLTLTNPGTATEGPVYEHGGTWTLTKVGGGTLVLDGPCTYGGRTNVNAGALRMTNGSSLGAGGFNATAWSFVYAGASLEMTGTWSTSEHLHIDGSGVGGAGAIHSLSGSQTITSHIALDGATATVGVDTGATLTNNAQFYGASGSLTKVGGGTLVLNGPINAFGGNTNINAGTLVLNGQLGTAAGTTTVAPGATLTGPGTVNGALVVDGIVSPGSSPGTMTAGNTTFNGGASFLFEINDADAGPGADPGWDLLSITGGLSILATAASPFEVDITSLAPGGTAGNVHDFSPWDTYSWEFARTNNGITGFDEANFNLDYSAFSNDITTPNGPGIFGVEQLGNSLYLTFHPVPESRLIPEPATVAVWALLGLCWAGINTWRRRGRRVVEIDAAPARRAWPAENGTAIRQMLERNLNK